MKPVPRTEPRRVLENMTTAVLTFDRGLRLTSINPAGEILFQVSAKRVCGRALMELMPHAEVLTQNLRTTLDSGHPVTTRGLRLWLPGERRITVDCSVTLIGDGDPELLVELSQIDRRMRLALEEHMSDQHAVQQTMLRGLAHEIKNPLGGLRGAAQLLEAELKDRELSEYTRIIIHEADRLRNLVDRMMGSSRPLKKELLNVHALLEHVRRLVSAEFPPTVTVESDYDPSVPEIEGDAEQLTQAFLNVVRNSAQAVGERGTVRLRTRIERQFTIGRRRHRLVVRTDVEDTGPGVPDELMDRIFYPMVSSKAEGTGLGLPIAQNIVHSHGGLITLDNQSEHTIFSIYLPLDNDNGT